MPGYTPTQRQIVQAWLNGPERKPACAQCKSIGWRIRDDCEIATFREIGGPIVFEVGVECAQCGKRRTVRVPAPARADNSNSP
jgi:hypothetical protein